jgi:hypothetical protein
VCYVVTEARDGFPMTTALRDALRGIRPDLFDSGFVEVVATQPAPAGFKGHWATKTFLMRVAKFLQKVGLI